MLEKYVSSILVPILSKYAENIDSKQLNIDLWNGQAALHNLVLRPSALDDLDLPIILKRGLCKTIRINIPFRNLQSKPCVVEIEELLLTVDSQLSKPYSEKDFQERLARQKEAALEQFERERKRRLEDQQQLISDNANSANKSNDSGYVSRLTEVIMNNLVVHVKAVHIRYENERSQIITGALLSGVHLFTADEAGQPTFIEPSKINKVRKVLQFEGLQVYCNERTAAESAAAPSSSFIFFSKEKTVADWEKQMRSVIANGFRSDRNTVFGPVKGSATTAVVFKSCIKSLLTTPYVQSAIHLDNFVAALSRTQYEMLLNVASDLLNWQLLAPFYQFRPVTGTSIIGNAKQWWKFAMRSVRFLIRKPAEAEAKVQQSLVWMDHYVELFKEKVLGKEGPDNEKKMSFVSQRMMVADMITCRRKVYVELADLISSKRRKQRELALQSPAEAPKKSSGWFSSIFSKSQGSKESQEAEREEQEFRELEKEWGITPGADQSEDLLIVDLPKEYCWSDIAVELPEFGVVTKLGGNETSEVKLKSMSVRLQTFNAPRCVNFDVAIGDFIVTNPQADSKNLVPFLISRQRGGGGAEEDSGASLLHVRGSSCPLSPSIPDANLDAEAYVSVLPLFIVADPPLLQKLLHFWRIPSSVDITSIEQSSRMIASAVQSAASAELSNAIGGSKSYLVKIDAAAPFVVLPRKLSSPDEPAVVLSLGHFHFESEPLTNSERERRIAVAEKCISHDEDQALDLHYYSNTARVESLFILLSTLGTALSATTTDVTTASSLKGFEIIPNIVIDFAIFLRIVSTAEHRDICVVRATCPEMRFAMSVHQSYILSTITSCWSAAATASADTSKPAVAEAASAVANCVEPGNDDQLLSTFAQLKKMQNQNTFVEDMMSDDDTPGKTPTPGTPSVKDLPQVRGSLQVGVFGFDVFMDQANKQAPPTRRFALHATPARVTFAQRTSGLLLETSLAGLRCIDDDAPEHGVILDGSDVCAVIRTPTGHATTIDIALEKMLVCQLGTPLMELTEHVLDMINLLSVDKGVAAGEPPVALPAAPLDDAVSLVMSVRMFGADVFLHNRGRKDIADHLFAKASASAVLFKMTKRARTMECLGAVSELEFHVSEAHQILPEHRRILFRQPSPGNIATFSYKTSFPPKYVVDILRKSDVSEPEHPSQDSSDDLFTNFFSLELEPTVVVYDACTVMTLLEYFTTGFISRLAAVGSRPRYDGKVVKLPPPPPRVLTRLSIHARDVTLKLPLNAQTKPDCFDATLSALSVTNGLSIKEATQRIWIRLHGFGISSLCTAAVPAAASHGPNCLIPRDTILNIALTSSLHEGRSGMQIDVDSKQIVLTLGSDDMAMLCELASSNILHMPAPQPQPTSATSEQGNSSTGGGTQTFVNIGRLAIILEGNSRAPFCSIDLSNLGILLEPPPKQATRVTWDSIAVRDQRQRAPSWLSLQSSPQEKNSVLLQCDKSSVSLFNKCEASKGNGELSTVAVTELDFSIDRLALSDQWLDIYDYILNEGVMKALAPLMGGPSSSPSQPATSTTPQVKKNPSEIRIAARRFVMPFLNRHREELFEARLDALDIVVASTPSSSGDSSPTTQIDVKISKLALVDNVRKLDVLSSTATITDASAVSAPPSLLSLSLTITPGLQKLLLKLEGLNIFVVMPSLNRLIHYVSHPCEPVAKISKLGVMREERARLERAAAETASSTVLDLQLQWLAPTIVVAHDAHSPSLACPSNLVVDLGHMSTSIFMNSKENGLLRISSNLAKARIDRVLAETSVGFRYESLRGQTEVAVVLKPAVVDISSAIVQQLMAILHNNLLVHGDDFAREESMGANLAPGSSIAVGANPNALSTESAEAAYSAKEVPTTTTRRIEFKGEALSVRVFDLNQFQCLTLNLNAVEFVLHPTGLMSVDIEGLSATEHYLNLPFLRCAKERKSVSMRLEPNGCGTLTIADTHFLLVPSAIGALVNVALSAIPKSETSPSTFSKNDTEKPASSKDAVTTSEFRIEINRSTFSLMRSSTPEELAQLSLDRSVVVKTTLADGSTSVDARIGSIALLDVSTLNTAFKYVLEPSHGDRGDHQHQEHFVVVSYKTLPGAELNTLRRKNEAFFGTMVEATVASVRFVLIPKLLSEVGQSAAAFSAALSADNADKASQRASSTAGALANNATELVQVSLTCHSPSLVIVKDPTVKDSIELFPGHFHVESLIVPDKDRSTSSEVFNITVDHVRIEVLGSVAFEPKKVISLVAKYGPLKSTNLGEEPAEVAVTCSCHVPNIEMDVSESQLNFMLDVAGEFMAAARQPAAAAAAGGGTRKSVAARTDDHTETKHVTTVVESKKPSLSTQIALQMDFSTFKIASVFELSFRGLNFEHKTEGQSSTMVASIDSFGLSHTSGLRTMQHLIIFGLRTQMNSHVVDHHVESSTTLDAENATAALTPTLVLDAMRLLYKPVCFRLLQSTDRPVCVLLLKHEHLVTLDEDLTLDAYHYLHVINDKLTTYVLDLGGNHLFLSGRDPAPMFWIDTDCSLTIRNGTLHLPGAYSFRSFFSFQLHSSVTVDASCKIVQDYFSHKSNNMAVVPAIKGSSDESGPTSLSLIRSRVCLCLRLLDDGGNAEIGLSTLATMQYSKRMNRDVLETQNFSCKLESLQTTDPRVLRRTSVEIDACGAEMVHVSLAMPAIEMAIRLPHVHALLKIMNETIASLSGWDGGQRRTVTSGIFDQSTQQSLIQMSKKGQCKCCGRPASLGTRKDSAGTICIFCATGKAQLHSLSLELKVPLIDVLIVSAKGEMVEAMVTGLAVTLPQDYSVTASCRGHLWTFNKHCTQWEPAVEQLFLKLEGNLSDHAWRVKMDRFEYVLSPLNMSLLSSIAAELSEAVSGSSQEASAFDDQSTGPIGVRHPASSPVRGRSHGAQQSPLTAPELVPLSTMWTAPKYTINAVVRNHTFESVAFDHDKVSLERSETSFTFDAWSVEAERSQTGQKEIIAMDRATFYPIGDIVVEISFEISPAKAVAGDMRSARAAKAAPLHRHVIITIFPYHQAGAFISVRSMVDFQLQIEGMPILSPTSPVVYLPSSFALENSFQIQPVNDLDDNYAKSETHSATGVSTYRDILNGLRLIAESKSASRANVSLSFRISSSSEGFACGVPRYCIRIEGGTTIQNNLPYDVRLTLASSTKHSLSEVVVPQNGGKFQCCFSAGPNQLKLRLQLSQMDNVFDVSLFDPASEPVVRLQNRTLGQELSVEVKFQENIITLTAPFLIINHTKLELHIVEVNFPNGKAKNFFKLPAEMLSPVAAFPEDRKAFFVNVSHGAFRCSSVPFHVQNTVASMTLTDGSGTTLSLVYMTQVNSLGMLSVVIAPRWTLVNRTNRPLYVGQHISAKHGGVPQNPVFVPAGAAVPYFRTTNVSNEEGYKMRISLIENMDAQGTPFPVDEISNTIAVARGSHFSDDPDLSVDVSVLTQGVDSFITFDIPKVPPYVFVNRSSEVVELLDSAANRKLNEVPPFQSRPFAFDGPRDLSIIKAVVCGIVIPIYLFREMTEAEKENSAGISYHVLRGVQGQVIISFEPASSRSGTSITLQPSPPVQLDIVLNVALVSLSVISGNHELVFGVLQDIRCHLQRVDDCETFRFSVKNFQFDNQVEESPYYESLCFPLRASKNDAAISGNIERTILAAASAVCINEIRLSIAQICLRADDTILCEAMRFYKALLSSSSSGDPSSESTWTHYPHKTPAQIYEDAPTSFGLLASQVEIQRTIINPVSIRVWFRRQRSEHDFFRQHGGEQLGAQSALVSMMVASCDDVTITAPGLTQTKRSGRGIIVVQQLTTFYRNGIGGQIVGLVLQYASSLPLIGAPIKLISGLHSGAVQFFKEPIEGLADSPEAFAKGLAMGSAGLVGSMIGGGFGVVANVASAGAKLANIASGNNQRERQSNNTLTGLVSGVTGIVTKPLQGAAEGGAVGLAKGIGQGLVGIVANPLSGLFSDVSKATNAVANVLADTYIPEVKRLRPIRRFYAGGGVAEYNAVADCYQYHRRYSGLWMPNLLPTDGPAWSPKTKEELAIQLKVPVDSIVVDKCNTTFDGWQFGPEYHGAFLETQTEKTHLRRRRWVCVVNPRPRSNVIPPSATLAVPAPSTPGVGGTPAMLTPATSQVNFSKSSPSFAAASQQNFSLAAPPVDYNAVLVQVVETFENQRTFPILGYGKKMLPTDRPAWSDRDGKRRPDLGGFALPDGWEWDDQWTVVGGGKDGWEYATDFGLKFTNKEGTFDCVRRRCWRRTMRKKR